MHNSSEKQASLWISLLSGLIGFRSAGPKGFSDDGINLHDTFGGRLVDALVKADQSVCCSWISVFLEIIQDFQRVLLGKLKADLNDLSAGSDHHRDILVV